MGVEYFYTLTVSIVSILTAYYFIFSDILLGTSLMSFGISLYCLTACELLFWKKELIKNIHILHEYMMLPLRMQEFKNDYIKCWQYFDNYNSSYCWSKYKIIATTLGKSVCLFPEEIFNHTPAKLLSHLCLSYLQTYIHGMVCFKNAPWTQPRCPFIWWEGQTNFWIITY